MPKYKSILFILCFLCMGFKYNIMPKGMPKGLPKEIKGNYRIIEHDSRKIGWVAYDVKSWKKFKDGLKMFPPVHIYEWGYPLADKWNYDVSHKPIENTFMEELVTIIDSRKKIKQAPKEGKQIPANLVKNIIASKLKNKNVWNLKSFPYKEGILVCGYNDIMPNINALWWSKGSKIYNVNGIARGNTKDFELTFDITISEAKNKCR